MLLRPTLGLLLLALVTPLVAAADKPAPFVGSDVLALRLGGKIEVGPQGTVVSHELLTEVSDDIRELLSRAIGRWRFEPPMVDGQPGVARSSMIVTLTAQQGKSGYLVRLDEVTFGSSDGQRGRWVLDHTKPRIRHPGDPVVASVPTQFLLSPTGEVLEASAERCVIQARAADVDNAKVCAKLERMIVRSVKHWRAKYEPAPGEALPSEPVAGVLSMHFHWMDVGVDLPSGQWKAEWRSAVRPAPWRQQAASALAAFGPGMGAYVQQNPVLRLRDGFVGLPL